jgi:hypothetical protein
VRGEMRKEMEKEVERRTGSKNVNNEKHRLLEPAALFMSNMFL